MRFSAFNFILTQKTERNTIDICIRFQLMKFGNFILSTGKNPLSNFFVRNIVTSMKDIRNREKERKKEKKEGIPCTKVIEHLSSFQTSFHFETVVWIIKSSMDHFRITRTCFFSKSRIFLH
jgi:hypothetical protein